MKQEKIGELIKKLRIENHLTQKELASKYHVTYQAVSKWENGKNLPDIVLLKQMSKDFGISIDELLNGEYSDNTTKKTNKQVIVLFCISIIILFLLTLLCFKLFTKRNDFEFKTLSAECDDFRISGTISYNENKSAIFISNIQYCGGNDTEEYKSIECILYEVQDNIEKKISSYTSNKENRKLEDFLQDFTLSIDNYEKTCKNYQDGSLYLSINATNQYDKVINYKIPLKLESCKQESMP